MAEGSSDRGRSRGGGGNFVVFLVLVALFALLGICAPFAVLLALLLTYNDREEEDSEEGRKRE